MRWARWYCILAVLGLGCERKAPGPDECLAFAYRYTGVVQPEQLRSAEVRDKINALTTQCLTTPFDHEYLQCMLLTRRVRACTVSFDVRRARP